MSSPCLLDSPHTCNWEIESTQQSNTHQRQSILAKLRRIRTDLRNASATTAQTESPISPGSISSRRESTAAAQMSASDPRVAYMFSLGASEATLSDKFLKLDNADNRRKTDARSLGSRSEWSVECGLSETVKNRYMNVVPWDRNRVKLNVPGSASDYINASPISLQAPGQAPRRYIACQGPTESTIPQFWHMIASDPADPVVVVMLTPTHEDNREKCAQYWPDRGRQVYRDSVSFSRVTLVDTSRDNAANCWVRKFKLEHEDHDSSSTKTVYHLYYESWGDFSAPSATQEKNIMALTTLAHSLSTTAGSPLVVHCSAGVGRTGTFIAIDFLLDCISVPADSETQDTDSEYLVKSASFLYAKNTLIAGSRADPVFETVNNLRRQRMLMVQNINQYIFIYRIVNHALLEE